eukprot:CAMPEP_0168764692 /NCGR_PEP_ID=MMETSP0724-20121128/25003_1 /TAXON_ID=265536 /ORGANISM="Amphiprora sp., Strain CCMP467" /LENGTH=518 /DNA_ID=CAMNT_0008813921 /DNA_START=74 /DNA_END=1630 /DNA_ORIENTATION=-
MEPQCLASFLQILQKRWRHLLIQDVELGHVGLSLVLSNEELNRECFQLLIQESVKLLEKREQCNNPDKEVTLEKTSRLERLSFRYVCFRHSDNNLREVMSLLCEFVTTNRSTLKVVSLDSCSFDSTYTRALSRHMDEVVATIRTMRSLEQLSLDYVAFHSHRPLTDGFSALGASLQALSLSRIILPNSSQYEQILSSIQQLVQLKALFLSEDSYMNDALMQVLTQSLQRLKHIQDLYIRRQRRLSPSALSSMATFLKGNQSLRLLDLLGNHNLFDIELLPSENERDAALQQIPTFASAILQHPQLQSLVLRNCGVNDSSANAFFGEFSQKTKQGLSPPLLMHLDLTMNSFHSPLQLIPRVTHGLSRLRELGLPPTFTANKCAIFSSDDEISRALHPNISLIFVFDAWRSGSGITQQRRAMSSNARTCSSTTNFDSRSRVAAQLGTKLKGILRRNQLVARVLSRTSRKTELETTTQDPSSENAIPLSLLPLLLEALGSNNSEMTPVYLFLCNRSAQGFN